MISIIIPVRNGALTITAQLDALASQVDVLEDYEVIVADNGSTDATREVVTDFRADFPLRLIDASSRPGVSHARNQGVLQAHGNPILICDADDEVDEGWIAAMSRAHGAGAELMGGVLDYRRLNSEAAIAWRGSDHAAVMMHRGFLPFAHGACCGFDRDVFDAIGGFDEALQQGGDDIDFFWRAQRAGFDLAGVDDAVVHYRLRNDTRGMARQAFHYGAADPALYAKFRAHGMGRRSARLVARTTAWLIVRSHWLLVSPARRGAWLWSAAPQAGRIVGSIRNRVLYL